jgi:hypothetical protein
MASVFETVSEAFGRKAETEDVEAIATDVATVTADVSAVQEDVSSVQAANDSLTTYFNTPRQVPTYAGYGTDDVSFHQAFIDGTSTPTLGTIVLCPVKVTQDRIYEAVKFGIDATTMTNFYIGLYALDQSTGDLTLVLDLGDCKAELNTGFDQQVVALPITPSVQRGEVFYAAFLQVGGTAAPMHRWSSANNWITGLYPRWIGNIHTTGSHTSLPGTIVTADVTSGTKFYAALGDLVTTVVPASKTYLDSFNRANSGSIGGSWTLKTGTSMEILNNQAVQDQAFFGTSPYFGRHSYTGRADTTSQRVKIKLGSEGTYSGSVSSGSAQNALVVGLRGNGLGAFVGMRLFISDGESSSLVRRVDICTFTAYNSEAGTQRATFTTTFAAADVFEMYASGNVYTVYKNGSNVLSWTDVSNVFPVGINNTEFTLSSEWASYFDFAVDEWEGADV